MAQRLKVIQETLFICSKITPDDEDDDSHGGVTLDYEELVSVDQDDDSDGVQTVMKCRHDVEFLTRCAALSSCSSTTVNVRTVYISR